MIRVGSRGIPFDHAMTVILVRHIANRTLLQTDEPFFKNKIRNTGSQPAAPGKAHRFGRGPRQEPCASWRRPPRRGSGRRAGRRDRPRRRARRKPQRSKATGGLMRNARLRAHRWPPPGSLYGAQSTSKQKSCRPARPAPHTILHNHN